MSPTRLFAAIAAASASVLAMTHLGANPVAPGRDLGVAISSPAGGNALILEADAGDLKALVRLTIDAAASAATYSARLENGVVLATRIDPAPGGSLLTVHEPGGSAAAKFEWPSGVALRITRDPRAGGGAPVGVAAPIRVIDWQVFSSDSESDSRSKATRRRWWWWLSSILLLVSGASAAWAAAKEKDSRRPAPHGARDCVEALIEEIEGESAEQTRLIRIFLRKRVLEHASYEEARDAMSAPSGTALKAIGKALHYFPDRLNQLVDDLLTIAVELQPDPPDEPPEAEAAPQPDPPAGTGHTPPATPPPPKPAGNGQQQ